MEWSTGIHSQLGRLRPTRGQGLDLRVDRVMVPRGRPGLIVRNSTPRICLTQDSKRRSEYEWKQWLRVTHKAITEQWIGYTEQRSTPDNNGNWLHLVHAHCQRRPPPAAPPQHPTQITRTPPRLA
jgi:hypothetical protein